MSQWESVLLPFRRDCPPEGLKKRGRGSAVAKKEEVSFGVLIYHAILIFSRFYGSDVEEKHFLLWSDRPSERKLPLYGTFGRWVVEGFVSYRKGSISNCLDQQPGM